MSRRDSLVLYAALVLLFVAGTLGQEPYDDAYFFKRFALNALEHGSLSWNASDGPVYGITSQLFLAISVALTALARDHTLLVTRLFLAASLVGAFAFSYAASRKLDRGFAAALAFCSPVVLFTITSGMETAFALLLVSLGLWLVHGPDAAERHWLWAPLVTLALWLTRPDALPLLLIPLLLQRRRLREALVLAGAAAAFLVAFRLYYGTALPLPFYAKQLYLSGYDPEFIASSAGVQRLHGGLFAFMALPLAGVALLRRDRENIGLLAAALLFTLYHALTTIDVMGMHARFYAPALPVLALGAARAAELPRSRRARVFAALSCALVLGALAVAGFLPGPAADALERVALPYYVLSGSGYLLLALDVAPIAAELVVGAAALAVAAAHGLSARELPSDEDFLRRHQARVTVFGGLETLRACFGDGIDVYHSEVGVPGLRLRHGRVFDLAGLFDRRWSFREQSFEDLCQHDAPDAIFLPHRNYAALNRTIVGSRCLHGYTRVMADSSSPLYVRNDRVPGYERCTSELTRR